MSRTMSRTTGRSCVVTDRGVQSTASGVMEDTMHTYLSAFRTRARADHAIPALPPNTLLFTPPLLIVIDRNLSTHRNTPIYCFIRLPYPGLPTRTSDPTTASCIAAPHHTASWFRSAAHPSCLVSTIPPHSLSPPLLFSSYISAPCTNRLLNAARQPFPSPTHPPASPT